MGSIAGVVAIDLQQFQFAVLRGERRLFVAVGFAEVADLVATGLELRLQAGLGQLRGTQAFLHQAGFGLAGSEPTLDLQHPPQTWHRGSHDAQ